MLLRTSIALLISVVVAMAQNSNERFYQSIRNNDLAALQTLVKEQGVNTPDSRGQTPLMNAAAFGSFEATKMLLDAGAEVKTASASGLTALHLCVGDIRKVRVLLDHGADVNARSAMRRTPLLVAAYTHGASETVRLLLDKGADVHAADATGLTPLIAAAKVSDTATAKLLLDHGADVAAQANIPQSSTALMAAAHNGNVELTKLLLARKASVNVASSLSALLVKNGTVQFGSITALHAASLSGNPDVVKVLLDAGAQVDASDMRGMTPLMWAVSTDRPNVEIIRMLLQKGANPAIRSKVGESTLDWARKFNNPAVLAQLKLEPSAKDVSALPVKRTDFTPRLAAERSMPLLQSATVRMLNDGGCIACHAQPMTEMAAVLVDARGWKLDKSAAAELLQILRTRWMIADQPTLQADESGGGIDTFVYDTAALAAAGQTASRDTDVLVHYLLAKQRTEGNWHGIGASRAPIQDGDFARTAMSIRTLAVYGMPGRRTEIDERIARGARWLMAQTPLSTEDRIMQLLGLKWANADSRVKETRLKELLAQQGTDGGWSQTPYLPADAYATGQVLYTLHESGILSTNPVFRRGVDYLLRTQRDDGSWYVRSRAMKIQPYFESGFPHGHDQWISASATAWATMALSFAESE